MKFEMLHSFNNNYELLCYITNTIKTEKQKENLFLTQYSLCCNASSFLVEGGREEGGGLLKISTSRQRAFLRGGLIRAFTVNDEKI